MKYPQLFLIFSLFVICSTANAQSSWKLHEPSTTGSFASIYNDGDKVWLHGYKPYLISFTENLDNRKIIDLIPNSNEGLGVTDIKKLPNGTYIAFGRDSASYRSTDGGTTWQRHAITNTSFSWGRSFAFRALHFIDNQIGFVSVWLNDSLAQANPRWWQTGVLLKTIDGGISWKQIRIPNIPRVTYIHFFNSVEGIASTQENYPIRTTNAGETWTIDSTLFKPYRLQSMCVLNRDSMCVSVEEGFNGIRALYTTTDAGKTWERKEIGWQGKAVEVVEYNQGQNRGYAFVFNDNKVRVSIDAGKSWAEYNLQEKFPDQFPRVLESYSPPVLRIHSQDSKENLWCSFANGAIITLSPAGELKKLTSHSTNLTSCLELEGTVHVSGYKALGTLEQDNSFSNSAWLIDTVNSVRGVTLLDAKGSSLLAGITNSGTSIKDEKQILHLSTDNGASWKVAHKDKRFNVYNAVLLNTHTIVASFLEDNDGYLFITRNGGDTWDFLQTKIPYTYPLTLQYEGGILYAAARNAIDISTDNGSTWSTKFLPLDSLVIKQLCVVSPKEWWVVSANSRIYNTVDAGTTWEDKSSSIFSNTLALKLYFNNRNIWAISGGELYESYNKGESWNKATAEFSKMDVVCNDVVVANGRVFAVGNSGTIYSRDLPVSVHEATSSGLTLSVYPTPSDHALMVSSNSTNPILQVQIIDLFGNVVSTFKGESSMYRCDVSMIPSGTYRAVATFSNGKKESKAVVIAR